MIITNTKNQTFPGLNSSKPLPCTELMTKLQCFFCCWDTDIMQRWSICCVDRYSVVDLNFCDSKGCHFKASRQIIKQLLKRGQHH